MSDDFCRSLWSFTPIKRSTQFLMDDWNNSNNRLVDSVHVKVIIVSLIDKSTGLVQIMGQQLLRLGLFRLCCGTTTMTVVGLHWKSSNLSPTGSTIMTGRIGWKGCDIDNETLSFARFGEKGQTESTIFIRSHDNRPSTLQECRLNGLSDQ